MTVQEFYELCTKHGMTNAEMVISINCTDDWYSREEMEFYEDEILLNTESNLVDICVNA